MITSPRHQGETSEWADANWRAVLEAAPDAMLVVNRTGEIVAANQQATKLYGYSREHLIGRVVESLIPGRLRDRHRQHRENFFANSEMPTMQVIEIFAVRSDASEIPVDVSLSHLTIGTETFAISVVRDATGRVRAEELKRSETILRESEQRFRLAAQAGKMYAYEWDVATDMVMRSEEHVSVLGFSQPRRLTRQELLARVHPEDHPLFVGSVGHLTPQNPTTQISYRVSRPDGSVVWLEKSARGFFDDQGKLLRVIGMVANVTERKRAEEALRESEARYEQLAEQSRTTNWEVDPKGRFTYVSHVPQASWGYRPDEVVGQMHFYDIHPEEGREAFKAAVFAAVERKQSFRDVVHAVETKDGRISWGSTNGVPVLNGDGTLRGYRGSCTDITERKRAEETLRESEEKFRSVFRDAGAGMVIVSPEGRFLAANKAFCDTLGYTEEELQEKTVESVTLSEDWPAFSKKLREALTEGRGFQWFEKRCLHKSGWIVYTASSTSLIRSRNGEPQYFVGDVLDVTMRKEAEQALADMTRKLIAAQEQERARIARELHDDINQRLAMLAIELEQLQDNPSEVRSRVQELRKQTTEISNDVQALSHDLHSSQVEYLGAVAGMKNWCKEFGERQRMQIDCRQDVRSTLPQEIGLCLFRVLQEALHNAAKHSGVKRIEVQLHEESGEIHLVVSDLGRGFDLETAMQGRGLGLTSMLERIRLVDGMIEIQSKPMGGTTVHVRVPLRSEHAPQRAAG